MDERDIETRNTTYGLLPELGRVPTAVEVAEAMASSVEEVKESWRRLHEAHALVLDSDGATIRMANPFSAVLTAYRVDVSGQSWFANCAWDAFGICAALHADGRIETSCPDCDDPLTIQVRNQRPDDESLVFHSLVPAAHWWDDIGFT